jgi:hypothetical protein
MENSILSHVYLDGANLSGSHLGKEDYRKGLILKEDLIGYKKCLDSRIVKLCIPKGAIVFSINGTKCRTNRAKVLEISDYLNEELKYDKAYSSYDSNFIYEVGREIEIEDFPLIYNEECESGIHFFRTRKEAIDY